MFIRFWKKIFGMVCIILLVIILAISTFAENRKYVIILDPGHGGVDGGTNTGVLTEKEYNFILAQYLRTELQSHPDFEIYLTREDDEYLKFLPRSMEIIEHNADLLISLHFNSSTASYVNGCDAYISVVDEYNTYTLADSILDGISSSVPIAKGRVQQREDTGDSLGIYYWNAEKKWDMPAAWWLGQKSDFYSMSTWASKFGVSSIIIEHGYLSNENDRAVIAEDANLRAIAKAEAQAIIQYFTGHEHTYTTEKIIDFPSNCTLAGTKSYRCTFCGAKKDTESLPDDTDAHYYRCTAERAVTCTEDGYAKYICQISYNLNDKGYPCEVHSYTTTTPALGHNYTVIENIPSTHGADGKITTVCKNCNDTITEIITGDAHNYEVTSETPPTCTEVGIKSSTCSVCGFIKEEKPDALGHDFVLTQEKPAGLTEDGYKLYNCSRCNEELMEPIPCCEHVFITKHTSPTCTIDGFDLHICEKCFLEWQELIPALGHSYEILSENPPLCTVAGIKNIRCLTCENEDDIILDAPGHDYEITYDGIFKSTKTCSVCGEYLEEGPINPTPAILLIVCIAVSFTALGVVAVLLIIKRKNSAPVPVQSSIIVESQEEISWNVKSEMPSNERKVEFSPVIEYENDTPKE